MKTLTNLIFAILLSVAVSGQDYRIVPFELIKAIADRNAASLWGNVFPADAIPYYWIDDEIVAWQFNYSIGNSFPSSEKLISDCGLYAAQKMIKEQWGNRKFGNIIIGARDNMPVVHQYSQQLSPEFALGYKLREMLIEVFGDEIPKSGKMYYLGGLDILQEYSTRDQSCYFSISPVGIVITSEEFRLKKASTVPFCISGDFGKEWSNFENGYVFGTKGDVFIYDHEVMPYYDWSYGCGPTSIAMLLAYHDFRSLNSVHKYANLITHHFQRWDHLEGETDYNVPEIQKLVAFNMGTDSMTYGFTHPHLIDNGIEYIANTLNGYSFNATNVGALPWTKINPNIDGNKPLVGRTWNHFPTIIGYQSGSDIIHTRWTWAPEITSINKYHILGVTVVVPGGSYGNAIKLLTPFGDARYNTNGQGEVFHAGNYHEILWISDNVPASTVDISYSLDGGLSFTKFVTNMPNTGFHNWFVPSSLNSTTARIRVDLHTATKEYAGADGSYGNFVINAGGFVAELLHGELKTHSGLTKYYRFQHAPDPSPRWGVVGVYAEDPLNPWTCELWDENFMNIHTASTSTSPPQNIVVLDANHLPYDVNYGVKIRQLNEDAEVKIQFQRASEWLSWTPGVEILKSWSATSLVSIYDLDLTPGKYFIKLEHMEPGMDLDMALFSTTDGIYFKSLSDAAWISSNVGNMPESFIVNITHADRYGLCIYARERVAGQLSITIHNGFMWTGNVDNNWHNANNWSGLMVPGPTDETIIPPATNFPIISAGPAFCRELNLLPGGHLQINTDNLTITNNAYINGILEVNGTNNLVCDGSVWCMPSATIVLEEYATIDVRHNWIFEQNSSVHMDNGTITMSGPYNSKIYVHSQNCAFPNLKIMKSNASVNFNEIILPGKAPASFPLKIKKQFTIFPTAHFIGNSSQKTILGGHVVVYATGQFSFNAGAVSFEMPGTSTFVIFSPEGSYFNDFEVNFLGTLELTTLTDIRGHVWIKNGSFNANGHNILVGGNWTNSSVFQHGNARVIFTGTGDQNVKNTNFWTLELAKPSGQLRFTQTTVTCQFYDWTQGVLRVNGGIFSAYGMMDPGIYGLVIVEAGELNLHQNPGSYIDLNGGLEISGGIVTITGGMVESYWPWAGNAYITMNGGVLDFYDVGIRVYNSPAWSFNSNITGGNIRTRRSLNVQRTDFNPTGGTFEFYGIDEDATIIVNEQSNLYNLLITKGTGDKSISKTLTATGTLDINGDFILSKGIFKAPATMKLAGNFINEQSSAYFEQLTGHLILDGSTTLILNKNENFHKLTIDKTGPGSLMIDNEMELKVFDKLTVETGVMQFNPGTSLFLHNGFESNYGGEVQFLGAPANEVLVTRAGSTNYAFDAMGGIFSAEYTIFEYMNNNGVNLHSGTYILADKALHHCTFRNGTPGGTLITWNQGATIVVQNTFFPDNTTGCIYNVTKTADNGNVFFDNATGVFAGPVYENDLYSRVHWEYVPPFDLPFTENWSSGNFSSNRWVKTSDNWIIDNTKGNPAPSARFNWNPSVTNYSADLRSHYLNATGYSDVFLAYDIAYENYSFATLEQFEVRVVLNNDDFLLLATYDNSDGDFTYISEVFNISAIASGNEIRIYFRAFGQNSYNIEGWFIDNIHVYGTPFPSAKLAGSIMDDSTSLPVENAFVILDGTGYYAYSQETGEYSIINISPGLYNISVTADDYELNVIEGVEFLPGETVMKDFFLIPIPQSYCTENLYSYGCPDGDGFDYFEMNSIQNLNSGCSDNGYGDFTAVSTDLARGYHHKVYFMTGISYQYVTLWIDLNDNFEFEESEQLLTNLVLPVAGTVYESDIFIPDEAPLGIHRLRIRTNRNGSSADPCAQYMFGEVEDYSVVITDEILYGLLSVTLKDYVSGDPVEDALVQISGTSLYGITEKEGMCIIEFINPGNYDIEISAAGYESLNIYNFDVIGNLVNYIDETLIPELDRNLELTVYLEGPYDVFNNAMQSNLQSAGLIPLSQPYDIGPWNYPGTEQVIGVPSGVVDWVLIELRDAIDAPSATELTTISSQAAFLMGDGSVKALDGVSQLSLGGLTVQHNLFCIIRHRNHLDVMSSTGLVLAGGVYAYDFSDDITKAYGSSAGYKQLNMTPPRFGMIAGDGKADGMVNTDDKDLPWVEYAGKKGYLPGDYNLNGQVDNLDKNDLWMINIGTQTQVPEN